MKKPIDWLRGGMSYPRYMHTEGRRRLAIVRIEAVQKAGRLGIDDADIAGTDSCCWPLTHGKRTAGRPTSHAVHPCSLVVVGS